MSFLQMEFLLQSFCKLKRLLRQTFFLMLQLLYMERKHLIYIFMAIGSAVGGYLPLVWGGSVFSMTSIVLTAVGGIAGIWLGFKIGSE